MEEPSYLDGHMSHLVPSRDRRILHQVLGHGAVLVVVPEVRLVVVHSTALVVHLVVVRTVVVVAWVGHLVVPRSTVLVVGPEAGRSCCKNYVLLPETSSVYIQIETLKKVSSQRLRITRGHNYPAPCPVLFPYENHKFKVHTIASKATT